MSAYTPVPHCLLREREKLPILLRSQRLHECALHNSTAATISPRRYVFRQPPKRCLRRPTRDAIRLPQSKRRGGRLPGGFGVAATAGAVESRLDLLELAIQILAVIWLDRHGKSLP
ncbi:MAG TPA: hypothetical protein VMR25_13800 [Planctomycetaceae bacterium]|nr:hypothetical protein [Planctomycetaceae bacterium]